MPCGLRANFDPTAKGGLLVNDQCVQRRRGYEFDCKFFGMRRNCRSGP
jgi:hypothetical protein